MFSNFIEEWGWGGMGDGCATLREGKMGDGMDGSATPRGPSPRPLGEEEVGDPPPVPFLKLKDLPVRYL